jgi:hypothetical protein
MQKLGKYLWLLLALPALAFTQDKDEELIDWNSRRLLTWADFKGAPNPNSDAAASTTTYLGIEYKISSKGFTYDIQCRFSRTRSWGLSKTEYILKHEQGHFDIAEIFARKLHKEMGEYKFNQNSYRKDLREIYERISKEKEDFQNRYDKETDHSRRTVRQTEWNAKISEMLVEYEDYTDY